MLALRLARSTMKTGRVVSECAHTLLYAEEEHTVRTLEK